MTLPVRDNHAQADHDVRRRVIVGVAAGTAALFMLLFLLLLAPLLLGGGGGGSAQGGGGGTGHTDAGGGRGDAGTARRGTGEVVEVAYDEGIGNQEAASRTDGAASATATAARGTAEDAPRRRRVAPSQEFTLSAIPDAEASPPSSAPASAGFNDVDDRLRDAGAQSGDVQVSLAWNNVNDLDLHVLSPAGEEIHFAAPRSSDGGQLDVDMNAGRTLSTKPVENIFWATRTAPRGKYTVMVNYYANRGGADPTKYQVIVRVNGRARRFEGSLTNGVAKKTVHVFQLDNGLR